MKNLFKIMIVVGLIFTSLPLFAQTTVETISTSLAATAADVATGAGVVIVAGLAIFGLVWGVRKLKSAVSSGA
ncbi:MAG: hypothetical protein P9L97_01450 [Candidatus Tenebribacter davisii]|nr:hypothetical protein [Candidatus Tenebribacter davisii]